MVTMDTPRNGQQQRLPIVPLHPANNGKVWLAVLGIIILTVIITVGVMKSGNTVQAAPVKSEAPKAAPVVSDDKPSSSTSDKSSNNSGKSINVNIEGNDNKVNVGDVVHHHYYEKTVIKEVTVIPAKVTPRPVRKTVVTTTTTTRAECDVLMEEHKRTVASWNDMFARQSTN